ncbi:MAG TPA: YggT family protein [Pyrinomonadaceae bacterium]|jgi:YggT family protein
MLTSLVFPIIQTIVIYALLIFVAFLIVRLIFNYSDPNPFGKIGRFSYHLKKRTDSFVYPAARLLASFRIDTRLAPIVTMLIAVAIAFFLLQIVGNTFFIIDELSAGILNGNAKAIIGIVLYAILSILVLFIFIRFIASWFVFTRNTFFGFVQRVTDPILIPFGRWIPRVGMLDISAMILLILIHLVQNFILRALVF